MLDPREFDKAMNRLKVLPTQGGHEGPEAFAMRKAIYYEALADLDTERFVIAAQELLRESGRVWFPTPGEIRAEAEAWQPSDHLLPAARRTPEEIAAGKQAAREGLALVRAAVASRLKELPPELGRPRPKERPDAVVASDERMDTLKRQAREIQDPEPAA